MAQKNSSNLLGSYRSIIEVDNFGNEVSCLFEEALRVLVFAEVGIFIELYGFEWAF